MSVEEIRKQMEGVARELWGKKRTNELAEQVELTAAALATLDAIALGSSDDVDYLEGR